MLNVIVTGAAGKMGKTHIKTVVEDKNARLAGAVEVKGNPAIGTDAGVLAGVQPTGFPVVDDLSMIPGADVLIDFTVPSSLPGHLEYAVKHNMALVIGTTGLTDKEIRLIDEASAKIPLIWAPNFSIGVNILAKLTKIAAEILRDDFDPEIVEMHHRMKKDAPSGTALRLLNILKDAYQSDDVVFGREGIGGERPAKQIGVMALRGGDVVGDHTVIFAGIGERVELTHKASTRETFARGALRAAKYITGKKPGRYTIEDVLGF
ncbi:MAG: 4-hydroxy-tetrahydrodipicolinate reductase [Spirochaetes bacterium GWF1_51_8]|nr:MAG: 4-hydroxy-tetrahydrodipicolinate reductase [Spirochaetes bacterium GWF1_51_8]